MRRIDLHTHTHHSDGTLSPTELVREAAAAELVAIAVTDHDTTSALEEAMAEGERRGLEVIAGCEISTSLDGTSVHVLGHGFAPDHPLLQDLLARVRAAREERNARMRDRLEELGCALAMDEVRAHATGAIVARPHFAKAMVERGYVADQAEAFDRYLKDGGPGHVVVARSAPEEAVATICAAGGVASLAHPKQIGLPDRAAWLAFLEPLKAAGLGGLEVDHPSHKASDRTYFQELAETLDLVRSGGSDFHGSVKPGRVIGRGDGTIRVGYEVWERLSARRCAPDAS